MKISDQLLLTQAKNLAKEEQLKTLQLLELLAEIERRLLYVKLGYSSLFTYLVQELCYGESEASLRVKAMRLTVRAPEVKEKIASGGLSLSSAATVETFAREQKLETPHQLLSLIEECEGKSTRELKHFLDGKKQKPTLEFTIKLTGSAAQKMARLKKLMPALSEAEIIEALLEEKLTRLQLGETRAVKTVAAEKKIVETKPAKAHIPKTVLVAIRRELHARASGRCEHTDRKTGQRCQSRTHLQVEHCYPRAWGGEHKLSNLMILCRSHNLARATQCFGVSKMAQARGLHSLDHEFCVSR